jgi:hypothetical protein
VPEHVRVDGEGDSPLPPRAIILRTVDVVSGPLRSVTNT